MPNTTKEALGARLKEIRAERDSKRSRRAVLARERNDAKRKFAAAKVPVAQLTGSPEFQRAERCNEQITAIDAEVEQLNAAERGVLQMLGEDAGRPADNGPSDPDLGGGDGWAQVARGLNLRDGATRVEVPARSLLRPAALTANPGSGLTHPSQSDGLVELGRDSRFLYAQFTEQPLDSDSLSIHDFRQFGARKSATVAGGSGGGGTVTTEDAHGYSDGERVVFVDLDGGDGITLGQVYYVLNATSTTFELEETVGDGAVDVTEDATEATVINLDSLGRTVTGSVERDPIATTDKATVDLSIALAEDPLRQFAVLVEDVPAKLFEKVGPLDAFLRRELRWQIDRALDAHTATQIMDANPLTGSIGDDLIAKVRNAVALLSEVGAEPSVLALSPTEAASLDLTQVGSDDLYLFLTRDVGSASPLWRLRVVEVPGLASPIVLDPAMTGVLYTAMGEVVVDPYTGLKKNLVRIRAEVEGLLHVRDANGAYVIA